MLVENVIEVYVPFDEERYEREKDNPDCSFYLDMIREGITRLNEHTPLPVEGIFGILDDFVAGGCVNEWIKKKRRFKEHDLQVILKCKFTRDYFQVRLIANSISRKEQIAEGIVMRTKPNPFIFDGLYRDVELKDNQLIVTTRFSDWYYFIDVEELKKGIFTVGIKGNQFFIERMVNVDYKEMVVVRYGKLF